MVFYMKYDLEMVFLLDRSGSMSGLERDTINGFNDMIQKQRKLEGHCLVSTVLFDNSFEVLHNRYDLQEIKKMTTDDYCVRGTTALLDAIGRSITKISNVYGLLSKEEKPEKTLFVITTDGMENASVEYTHSKIKQMIKLKTDEYGWEFLFLGANIDAVDEAEKLGIRKERVANYHADSMGTKAHYSSVESAITSFRQNKNISDKWNDEVNKDFINRNENK